MVHPPALDQRTDDDDSRKAAEGPQHECVEGLQRLPQGGRPRIDAGTRRTFKIGPALTFDYRDNPPTRTGISQFPLLPCVGLTVEF